MAREFPTDAELHKAATELVNREHCDYIVALQAVIGLANASRKPVGAAYAMLEKDGELDQLINAYWQTFGGNYLTALEAVSALAASKGVSILDAAQAALKDSKLYEQAQAFVAQHGGGIDSAMKVLADIAKLKKK
ncbi:MAG TPA: hypothetical protein PK306_05670 [Aquabacterium sp.]|nr:hypothetical protein [Aquabacterium sp.]